MFGLFVRCKCLRMLLQWKVNRVLYRRFCYFPNHLIKKIFEYWLQVWRKWIQNLLSIPMCKRLRESIVGRHRNSRWGTASADSDRNQCELSGIDCHFNLFLNSPDNCPNSALVVESFDRLIDRFGQYTYALTDSYASQPDGEWGLRLAANRKHSQTKSLINSLCIFNVNIVSFES